MKHKVAFLKLFGCFFFLFFCFFVKSAAQISYSLERKFNLYPKELDNVDYFKTYYRQIIGVDSEDWIYCSQRCCNNDLIDRNVKIVRTKDFIKFEDFMIDIGGCQLIELENKELCFAGYIWDIDHLECAVFVTSENKTVINKKFVTTSISSTNAGCPWSWGISARGNMIAVGEYGAHGKCGGVWYSRDLGKTFYKVFWHEKFAPDYAHAHVHGVCVDPCFKRLYIFVGDGVPSTTPELLGKNDRIYYWDDNNETLSDDSWNRLKWKWIEMEPKLKTLQFCCGYALQDCILLSTDGPYNGIYKIPRKRKEDKPEIKCALDLGTASFTKYCGGNMFKRNDDSPLFVCLNREYSNDLDSTDIDNNPSKMQNTYKNVKSKVFATFNGLDFYEIWEDNTFGEYNVWNNNGKKEMRNVAKCGRDMSVYQLSNDNLLLKYIGRQFSYVGFNDNGVTSVKTVYHRFNNEVLELKKNIYNQMDTIIPNSISIYTVDKHLIIISDRNQNIPIYNIDGKLVQFLSIYKGSNSFQFLHPGLYIIANKKIKI